MTIETMLTGGIVKKSLAQEGCAKSSYQRRRHVHSHSMGSIREGHRASQWHRGRRGPGLEPPVKHYQFTFFTLHTNPFELY